jgi:hypothetical protein
VVVKAKHAVVTVMAMRSPNWPEYIAELAKLKLGHMSITTNAAVKLWLQIEYFLIQIVSILVKLGVYLCLCSFIKVILWNNSRVCQASSEHKDCAYYLQRNSNPKINGLL